MEYINHNTSLHTSKHLSYEEHFYIEKQLHANISKSAIIKALDRSRTTIYTKIKRGTVVQIKQGKSILMYLADFTQYLKQLSNEQQIGIIHCPEKSSVTVRSKRYSLTKSKKLTEVASAQFHIAI